VAVGTTGAEEGVKPARFKEGGWWHEGYLSCRLAIEKFIP